MRIELPGPGPIESLLIKVLDTPRANNCPAWNIPTSPKLKGPTEKSKYIEYLIRLALTATGALGVPVNNRLPWMFVSEGLGV
jgi:hypothetical protein